MVECSIIVAYDWSRSLDLKECTNSSERSLNRCVFRTQSI